MSRFDPLGDWLRATRSPAEIAEIRGNMWRGAEEYWADFLAGDGVVS